MKAFSKLGLLLAVALLGVAATAMSAQAAPDINPDNTEVVGVAANPTLSYGGVTVVCPEGTAVGTTGSGVDPSIDVELQFGPPGECTVNTAAASTVCQGTAEILALNGTTNIGTANLNTGFQCVVTVPFTCSITVAGPQNPNDADAVLELLNEGNAASDAIDADVDVNATRQGTSFCGAASGTANFTAVYDIQAPTTPDTLLSIDEVP